MNHISLPQPALHILIMSWMLSSKELFTKVIVQKAGRIVDKWKSMEKCGPR